MNYVNIFKCLSVFILVFLMSVNSFADQEASYIITGSIQDYKDSDSPEYQQAEKAWNRYGVDSFRVLTSSEDKASIGLYDENQEKIGTLNLNIIENRFETFTIKGLSGIDITLMLNKAMTFFRLTDNISREAYNANLNMEKSAWIKDNESFFEAHEDVIILMMSIKAKFVKSINHEKKNSNYIETNTRVNCYGSKYMGNALGHTKSLCCEAAKNSVNNQCNNYYCLGCCSLNACDSACGVGDAVCTCSMIGQSCSE